MNLIMQTCIFSQQVRGQILNQVLFFETKVYMFEISRAIFIDETSKLAFAGILLKWLPKDKY